MNSFTPKTDDNLNFPHKINTPTKMASKIRENWPKLEDNFMLET